MTTSRKRKSSSTLSISRPYAQQARTIRFHRTANNRTSTSTSVSHSALPVALSAGGGHPLKPLTFSLQEYADDSMLQCDVTPADTQDLADSDHEVEPESKGKSKRRTRTKTLDEWSEYRDAYLQELLRHEGRASMSATICVECGQCGDFTCTDCAYRLHYCKPCMIDRHRLMPLHRVKVSLPTCLRHTGL
jgi:hypothetical protein